MNDPSYWQISDLEVGSAGAGILVYYTTLAHEGLRFTNLFFHDIRGIHQGNRVAVGNASCDTTDGIWNSAGLVFTGRVNLTASDYVLRDVLVSNVEGTHNQATVSFDWCNSGRALPSDSPDSNTVVRDVVIGNLYFHNDDGPALGCDEGLRLVSMRNVTLMDSRFIAEGGCASGTGTIGIFLGQVKNVTLVNNVVTLVPNTGSPDQGGIDFEIYIDDVTVRNNLIAGNAGPGIELLAIYDAPNHMDRNSIVGNTFRSNGAAGATNYLGGVNRTGTNITPTGAIQDNLFFEPSGLLSTGSGGNFAGITVSNNVMVSSSADLTYSAESFSNVQGQGGWSYQRSADGNSWSPLSFDAGLTAWASNGTVPLVTRFEQHPEPSPSAWVARVWTAPRAGTVSVRGRVLKSDTRGGDGVIARITRNGGVVWGPQQIGGSDRVGVDTNIDGLVVGTDDNLRFEISANGNNAYDFASWAPALGYTSALQLVWNFDNDLDGWTLKNELTGGASAGAATLTSVGNDPYLWSPDALSMPTAQIPLAVVRMRNATPASQAQFFFTTSADASWSESKSILFSIKPNDTGYSTYAIELGQVPTFVGVLKQLRLDPTSAPGGVNIDYVRVLNPARIWNFDAAGDLQGWTLANQLDGSTSDGSLQVNSTGTDPYMLSPDNLNIDAATHRSLTIRMRNGSSGVVGQVYFTTATDPVFSAAKNVNFDIVASDTGYTTYTIDLGQAEGWTGTIRQIRVDPTVATGPIAVDFVRLN